MDWEDALDQSQTRTERAWSLSGGLLQVWSTTAFRILAKSLHLRSLLRKLMRYTVNFNVCSWQWSTESPNSSPHLTEHCTTTVSKVEQIGLKSFAPFATFTWPLEYHFFKHLDNFLQGKPFQQPAGCRKLPFNSLLNPKTQIFKL